MAELEPALAKVPFLHQRTLSIPRASANGLPKPLSSPRTSAPATPDKDRGTDPLSAHIIARTQTTGDAAAEAPSFRRNISELVIGKDKTSPDLSQVPHALDSDKRDRKKRVSFFAKLRGKDGPDETHNDSTDDLSRAEGAHASAFARSETHKVEQPTYIRIRSHNKPKRDFNNVFLAQELVGSDLDHETTSSSTEPKSSAIWSMKFSTDGRYLATGGQDMIVRVWRVLSSPKDRQRSETGEAQVDSALNAPVFCAKPYREYAGHTADVLDLSWSKNNFLLSSSMDKTVRLWHVTRDECLCCFQHSDFVTSIAFHPKDDRFFLSGSLDCKLRLWNIPKKHVEFWNELPELITAVAFDPIGRMAIAGSFTGLCLFYETDGLRYHTQMHVKSTRGKNSRGSKITGIQTVGLQPDNVHGEVKLLITSNDSRIRLYNLRDKSLITKFKGNDNTCSQIRGSFSNDCKYIICGSEDREVYIWNTDSDLHDKKGKTSYEHFEAHTNIVSATVFAPNKTRELLAASGDPIYDTVQRNSQQRPSAGSSNLNPEHANDHHSYLSPTDGNIIISADYTGCIKIFRQDSAAHFRHKVDDRSETLSTRSKSVMRHSSIRSSRTNSPQLSRSASMASHDTNIVVRKPHEIIVPVSPARHKTTETVEDEANNPPPTIHFDKPPTVTSDDTHTRPTETYSTGSNNSASHSHKPKSKKHHLHLHHHHQRESSRETNGNANPYIAPGGASFGFYDVDTGNDSPRPSALRQESTTSWSDSYQQKITCSECAHHAFTVTRVGTEMRLKCQNCHHLVTE